MAGGSDLAKGFEIPVVHVNADDAPACLGVAKLAFAYRERYRKDFVIDLIGYRRRAQRGGRVGVHAAAHVQRETRIVRASWERAAAPAAEWRATVGRWTQQAGSSDTHLVETLTHD